MLEVFELLIIFVRLLGPIHGSKGVVGSSFSTRLSTLIASRVIAFVVLLAAKYPWSWLIAYQTRREAWCRVPWESITL